MDGTGDAGGYRQGEIGEIKFTGLRTGKERAGIPLSSCSRLRASQLTYSQSLGSSAKASSPSVWGRWIFDSLRLASPDERGIPAPRPFLFPGYNSGNYISGEYKK